MNDSTFPIWFLGKDDELIRQHMGVSDLSALQLPHGQLALMQGSGIDDEFYPSGHYEGEPICFDCDPRRDPPCVETRCRVSRRPKPGPPGPMKKPKRKQGEFTLAGKGAVDAFKSAKDVREFGQIASRFTIGQNGRLARFRKNPVKGSTWRWKSVTFEDNRLFRRVMRTPMRDGDKLLPMHHKTMQAKSPQAAKLRIDGFTVKGIKKGWAGDFRWALIGIGAEAVWQVYEGFRTGEGWGLLREYLTSDLLWDLAKAVVKALATAVATAALTTAVAAFTTVAIIPAAVGIVVSIGIDCAGDEAMGDESMCRAGWQWLTDKPPPPFPQAPVIKPAPDTYDPNFRHIH